MESAAARCLAITEIVELVIDHSCASNYVYQDLYQDEKNILVFRRINRLWQDVAEKRLTLSIVLYQGHFRSRYYRLNLSQLFTRRPGRLQTAKEVRVVTRDNNLAAELSPLLSLHNVTSIELDDDMLLEPLAAVLSDTPAQLQQIVQISISIRYGKGASTPRAGRFLQCLPSLRILRLAGAWSERAIGHHHSIDIVEGCQPRIEELSLALGCHPGGVLEYLSGFLDPSTNLRRLSITFYHGTELPGLLAAIPRHIQHLSLVLGRKQIRLLLVELADSSVIPNLKRVPTLNSDCRCHGCLGTSLDVTKEIVQAALEGLRKRGGVQDLETEGPRLFRFVRREAPGNIEDLSVV